MENGLSIWLTQAMLTCPNKPELAVHPTVVQDFLRYCAIDGVYRIVWGFQVALLGEGTDYDV
jgi:hypothetical protein